MAYGISGRRNLFLSACGFWTADLTPREAGEAHSALAAAIVRAMFEHTTSDFEARFGKVSGGRCVILGMGKLGSHEMTAASDLDMIVIYDFDAAHPDSDGATPSHATNYYTRLSQRLISGLTVATRRGRLYDVDMRLRPSREGKGRSRHSSRASLNIKKRKPRRGSIWP